VPRSSCPGLAGRRVAVDAFPVSTLKKKIKQHFGHFLQVTEVTAFRVWRQQKKKAKVNSHKREGFFVSVGEGEGVETGVKGSGRC